MAMGAGIHDFAGGLQGVEEESGVLAVDLAGDDEAHDLHERDLDRVGVFEDGERDGDPAAAGAGVFGAIEVELDDLFVVEFVEVTEAVAAQGGRTAERAVDFDVLAPIWEIWHCDLLSPSPTVYWNHGVSGILRFNLLVTTS